MDILRVCAAVRHGRREQHPDLVLVIVLLVWSALLGWIAYRKTESGDRYRIHWWVLCAGFAYLSMDETAMLHEKFIKVVQLFGGPSEVFLMAWVIPAILVSAVVGLAYIQFLRHLPRGIRAGFLISAALYLGGSIGLEMVAGSYLSGGHSQSCLTYAILAHVEEVLEMAGIVSCLGTLLAYTALREGPPGPTE